MQLSYNRTRICFRSKLRLWMFKRLGVALWRTGLPHGADVLFDLLRIGLNVQCAVDVGANVGRFSHALITLWPAATVHAFEPVEGTFSVLEANVKSLGRARCWRLALSNTTGDATINLDPVYSEVSSLSHAHPRGSTEVVHTISLDDFCAREGLEEFDLLKIDTEGHERSVLKGAEKTFQKSPPKACIIEAGFNGTQRFVDSGWLTSWFQDRGYGLAGVYDPGLSPRLGFLERADLLFFHKAWRNQG